MKDLVSGARFRWIVRLLMTVAVVGAAVIYLTGRKDFSRHELLGALADVSPLALLAVFLLSSAQILFMVERLWLLRPRSLKLSWFRGALGFVFGHAINQFFPARIGEALKVMIVGGGVLPPNGYLMAAGLLVADHVIDLGTLVLWVVAGGTLFLPQFPSPTKIFHARTMAVVVGIAVILVLALWLGRRRYARFVEWLGKIREGLSGLWRARPLTLSSLSGAAAWAAEGIALYLLCRSQGVWLGVAQVVFILLVINLAIAIPVSVANVGTFEASIVVVLRSFGMPLEKAIAVAAIHHFLQLVATLVWVGIMTLLRDRAFGQLSRRDRTFKDWLQGAQDASEAVSIQAEEEPLSPEEKNFIGLIDLSKQAFHAMIAGCRSDRICRAVKRAGIQIFVIDESPINLSRVANFADEVEVASIGAFESDRTFDRVICYEGLIDSREPARAFAKLCTLVSAKGCLLVRVPEEGLTAQWYRLSARLRGRRHNIYRASQLVEMARDFDLSLAVRRKGGCGFTILSFVRR